MTQEQRITKGTVTIFILSITLLICLGVTTVLAYFAGSQTSNTTLVMGGPVYVSLVDKELFHNNFDYIRLKVVGIVQSESNVIFADPLWNSFFFIDNFSY